MAKQMKLEMPLAAACERLRARADARHATVACRVALNVSPSSLMGKSDTECIDHCSGGGNQQVRIASGVHDPVLAQV